MVILLFIFFLIIFLYSFFYKKVSQFKSFIDFYILKIPLIWEVIKNFNHYRFSKLLWDFYNAWVSPTIGLNQISEILKNYHYKKKVVEVKDDLEVGLWFIEAMEWSWLFDQILIQIIWVGESTWNIWDVLTKISDFYRQEVNSKTEWLTKTIEPILMAFVAVVIWIIVAAVFLPMADLVWNIG